MTKVVGANKVVRLRYVLWGERNEELERSEPKGEAYLHGAGHIPVGLERALEGRSVGEKLRVQLSPEDGYGRRKKSPGPQPIPRATFPPDAELKPGLRFTAESPDGHPVTLYIVRVERDAVFVDTNHPHAGRSLAYDVEIVSIRDATAAEKRARAING
jgi:FKBP-type peptidyl-prolyl cis-trans isomerase SlyD